MPHLNSRIGTLLILSAAFGSLWPSRASSDPTPCAQPSSDTAGLFALIKSQATVDAVSAYLQGHAIAWDALDENCETSIAAAFDQNRLDTAGVILSHYPELELSERPVLAKDSIFSYALAHGSSGINVWIRSKAASTHQTLTLGPVVGTGGSYPAGTTELMMASEFNPDAGVVRGMLSADPDADVNQADLSGKTALMLAASSNPNISVVQALLAAGASPSERDSIGATALMYAAKNSANPALDRMLIKARNNVNAVDKAGVTALMYAVAYNPVLEVFQVLTKAGARLNSADVNGKTILMYAAANSSASISNIVIHAGVDVNQTDVLGLTALMYAAGQAGSADIVTALIQAGASVNATAPDGETALMFDAATPRNSSATSGASTYQEPLQDDIAQALIEAGASKSMTVPCSFCAVNPGTAYDIALALNAPTSLLSLLK